MPNPLFEESRNRKRQAVLDQANAAAMQREAEMLRMAVDRFGIQTAPAEPAPTLQPAGDMAPQRPTGIRRQREYPTGDRFSEINNVGLVPSYRKAVTENVMLPMMEKFNDTQVTIPPTWGGMHEVPSLIPQKPIIDTTVPKLAGTAGDLAKEVSSIYPSALRGVSQMASKAGPPGMAVAAIGDMIAQGVEIAGEDRMKHNPWRTGAESVAGGMGMVTPKMGIQGVLPRVAAGAVEGAVTNPLINRAVAATEGQEVTPREDALAIMMGGGFGGVAGGMTKATDFPSPQAPDPTQLNARWSPFAMGTKTRRSTTRRPESLEHIDARTMALQKAIIDYQSSPREYQTAMKGVVDYQISQAGADTLANFAEGEIASLRKIVGNKAIDEAMTRKAVQPKFEERPKQQAASETESLLEKAPEPPAVKPQEPPASPLDIIAPKLEPEPVPEAPRIQEATQAPTRSSAEILEDVLATEKGQLNPRMGLSALEAKRAYATKGGNLDEFDAAYRELAAQGKATGETHEGRVPAPPEELEARFAVSEANPQGLMWIEPLRPAAAEPPAPLRPPEAEPPPMAEAPKSPLDIIAPPKPEPEAGPLPVKPEDMERIAQEEADGFDIPEMVRLAPDERQPAGEFVSSAPPEAPKQPRKSVLDIIEGSAPSEYRIPKFVGIKGSRAKPKSTGPEPPPKSDFVGPPDRDKPYQVRDFEGEEQARAAAAAEATDTRHKARTEAIRSEYETPAERDKRVNSAIETLRSKMGWAKPDYAPNKMWENDGYIEKLRKAGKADLSYEEAARRISGDEYRSPSQPFIEGPTSGSAKHRGWFGTGAHLGPAGEVIANKFMTTKRNIAGRFGQFGNQAAKLMDRMWSDVNELMVPLERDGRPLISKIAPQDQQEAYKLHVAGKKFGDDRDKALDWVGRMMAQRHKEAQGAGIELGWRENYLPAVIGESAKKRIKGDAKLKDRYRNELISLNPKEKPEDIDAYIARNVTGEAPKVKRGEDQRETRSTRFYNTPLKQPDWVIEKNLQFAVEAYMHDTAEVIARARHWGPKMERLDEMADAIRASKVKGSEDTREFETLAERGVGIVFDGLGESKKAALQLLQDWQYLSKMTLSGPRNGFDFLKSLVVGGNDAWEAAFQIAFSPKARAKADLMAGTGESSVRRQMREAGIGGQGSILSGAIEMLDKRNPLGLAPFERFVRRSYALTAEKMAERMLDKLKRSPDARTPRRVLERLMGSENDPAGAKRRVDDLIQQGYLDEESARRMANRAVRNAQPVTRAERVGYGHTVLGRTVSQFGSFPVTQWEWLTKEVLDEAAVGNFAPLIRFVGYGVLFGEISYFGRSLVGMAPERESVSEIMDSPQRWTKMAKRSMKDMMEIGGIGLLSDVADDVRYGTKGAMLSLVAGPTGTMIADLAQDANQFINGTLKKEPEKQAEAVRSAARNFPVVGPAVRPAERLGGLREDKDKPEEADETFASPFIEALFGGSKKTKKKSLPKVRKTRRRPVEKLNFKSMLN